MTLIEKLENNKRLSYEDGVALYELDLFTLGHYANMRRRARHGNKAFFNINRHINPTNICKDICKFCAFSANRKNPNPYTLSHEEILSILDDSVKNRGITEVHIVSAHNPDTGLEWYLEIFSKVKARFPSLHVKALTAAEINFLSEEYGLSVDAVIEKMLEYGVDSMPGGGAEIFDEDPKGLTNFVEYADAFVSGEKSLSLNITTKSKEAFGQIASALKWPTDCPSAGRDP